MNSFLKTNNSENSFIHQTSLVWWTCPEEHMEYIFKCMGKEPVKKQEKEKPMRWKQINSLSKYRTEQGCKTLRYDTLVWTANVRTLEHDTNVKRFATFSNFQQHGDGHDVKFWRIS